MAYLWVKGTGNQLWNPPEESLGRWAGERSPARGPEKGRTSGPAGVGPPSFPSTHSYRGTGACRDHPPPWEDPEPALEEPRGYPFGRLLIARDRPEISTLRPGPTERAEWLHLKEETPSLLNRAGS